MKIKQKIICVIALFYCFFLVACGKITTTKPMIENKLDSPLKIYYENTNGAYYTYCVVDDDTSVNYIVVSTERGNGEYLIAITPRMNPDGTLYISK